MTHPGKREEAIYIRQVQRYRRRFPYTMVHDRRDRRAGAKCCSAVRPAQHETTPNPPDAFPPAAPCLASFDHETALIV